MRADVRRDGMMRPDLLQALRDLASVLRPLAWRLLRFHIQVEGRHRSNVSRGYHPNTIWGGYSDYFGFGTDEFLALSRKLSAEPLIMLAAPGTTAEQVQYAMDWVHYLNDPADDPMGTAACVQRTPRALRRAVLPDRQRAHE